MDDVVLVVGFVDGEVDHEAVACGAVPVFLVGFEQDAVAGVDDFDGPAAALAQADAFGDEDGLAEGVAVPVGSGAGHEVDQVRGDPRRRGCGGDGVDVHVAGEPVAGSFGGGDGAAGDLHQVPSGSRTAAAVVAVAAQEASTRRRSADGDPGSAVYTTATRVRPCIRGAPGRVRR